MSAPDTAKHPCFNVKAKGECGRVHLPVAPKCNIMCNYCNRKYDCVNESRPGVTSGVLKPHQALDYLTRILEKDPRITVVGIAGPGDPFANPKETLETLRLIRERFPRMLFCLSSNGLGVLPYLDDLKKYGVTHMTITVNAVDPEIGRNFYAWVRDGKVLYRGLEAAKVMWERQQAVIAGLKERGIIVKVNTIVTPGINDHHVEAIAAKMRDLGVDLLNCMPLFPAAETIFEDIPEPGKEEIERIRSSAEKYLPQMRHCKRCRADAVGLLDQDKSGEFASCLSACSKTLPPMQTRDRPYVAVASMEGVLINQHLGEASSFQIWAEQDGTFTMVEVREAPPKGGGAKRWYDLARTLKDCRAVLVSGVGDTPMAILGEEGIKPLEMSGFIQEGLAAVYRGGNVNAFKHRREGKSCKAMGCTGDGGGCG
ncbi:radical SAM protein [Desulfonatronum parangueonense]